MRYLHNKNLNILCSLIANRRLSSLQTDDNDNDLIDELQRTLDLIFIRIPLLRDMRNDERRISIKFQNSYSSTKKFIPLRQDLKLNLIIYLDLSVITILM